MATPVRRPESSAAHLPGPVDTARQVADEPLDQTRDFGWMLVVAGALVALFLSWTLFPTGEPEGMWASYWVTGLCSIALLGAAWLRSTLPVAGGVALAGLSGVALILVGALHDYDTTITISMVVGGALMTLGAAAQARS